jgi:hypothetical protein
MLHANEDDVLPASLDSSHHNGGRKIRARLFLLKNQTFKPFQQKKNTSITPLEHSQINSSTQNTQQRVQISKIKPV